MNCFYESLLSLNDKRQGEVTSIAVLENTLMVFLEAMALVPEMRKEQGCRSSMMQIINGLQPQETC